MVIEPLEWRWVIARACITPISEDQPQKGRLLTSGRSFGPSAREQADLNESS
jgi:hypothetical protein